MTTKERNRLKKAFSKRSMKRRLVEKCGYSRRFVNYVMNGERENDTILSIAKQILESEKNK